jgi:hypothetical protein
MLGGGRGPLDATELGLDLLIDGSVAVASRLHRFEHDVRRLHAKRRRLRLLPGELLTVADHLHERVHAELRGLQ